MKDIKKKQAKINFNLNETNDGLSNDSKEKILIKFNIKNCKKDYKYHLKFEDLSNEISQESKFIICKEPEKSLNLLETIFCYEFGKMQKLSIGITIKNQTEKSIHNKEIIIGELIGNNKKNKNNKRTFSLEGNDEKLEISSEILKKQTKFLRILFYIDLTSKNEINDEKKFSYFQDEKYKMFFKIVKSKQILYESEVFTDDGKFNIVQIPTKILDTNFNIVFYTFKKDENGQIIEEENNKLSTNFIELANNYGNIICERNLSKDDKLIIINYSSIGEEISFLDYIKKGGIRIGLNIGIDFTKSNKPPNDPTSLHSYVNDQKNPYEKAILACGKILEYYDYDLLFPVYGFGAVVNGETSYCFNINFEDNPEIELVDNIIKVYQECIQKILFSGPTYFAPIINKIISNIKEQNDPREYQVLMILTDGIIQDMPETINALVEGSYYPLSVIIIGIGDANFEKMKQLDGDKIPLISRKGIKRQRDLVQFVEFNKYEGDANKLVYEVLEEIPRQVIEYYTLNYVYPDMIKEEGIIKINNIDNFAKDIKKCSQINNNFNFNNEKSYKPKNQESNEIQNYKEVKKMFPKKTKKNEQKMFVKKQTMHKIITSQRLNKTICKNYETFSKPDSSNYGLNNKLTSSTLMSEDASLPNNNNDGNKKMKNIKVYKK